MTWDTVAGTAVAEDVLDRHEEGDMKRITAKLTAAAALVVFGVAGTATAAQAIGPNRALPLCGSRSLVETVQSLPTTVGGPYVLTLSAVCYRP